MPPPVMFAGEPVVTASGTSDRMRVALMIVAIAAALAVACFGLGYLVGRIVGA